MFPLGRFSGCGRLKAQGDGGVVNCYLCPLVLFTLTSKPSFPFTDNSGLHRVINEKIPESVFLSLIFILLPLKNTWV